MKIIQEGANTILNQIEEEHLNYDFHSYLIWNGNYVYNAVTGDVAVVDDIKKDRSELIARWFMVPSNMDLSSLLYFQRQVRIARSFEPTANDYTIFTTMKCNASCEYCFQHGGSDEYMSESTANAVASYISDHTNRQRLTVLRWFGGEPLVNKSVIDIICKSLRANGINFRSNMSSNADLFSEITDAEIYLWNLKTVQITLDDVGDEYSKIKGLPSGAYERLIDTIRRFEPLDIGMNVRVHYHPEKGIEPIRQIISDLKPYKNVYIYAAMLYDVPHSKEDYEMLYKIEDELIEAGVLRFSIGNADKVTYCMADSGNSRCIRVDGSITPCEHYSEGETSGSIYSDDFNDDVLSRWMGKRKYEKKCNDCPLYPTCEILSKCPSVGKCEEGYKDYRIERVRRVLKQMEDSDE